MARIIVTGATGFIGRHVVATLLDRRHTVVGVHREPAPPSLTTHPRFESVSANFVKMTAAEKWTTVLGDADAVINCESGMPSAKALFEACASTDVKRVIQISAKGLGEGPEDTLMATDLDWVVVRPSLVYGPGSFDSGANLFGLAACPGAILLPGDGAQTFQPICIDDLVGIVCELCEATSFSRIVIEPVGPEHLTLKEILLKLRAWLDVSSKRTLKIPHVLFKMITKTTLPLQDNGTDAESFNGLYAPSPLKIDTVLAARPSTAQDQSQARQVLLAPIITGVLALYWLVSGGIGLMRGALLAQDLTEVFGSTSLDPVILAWGFSGWEIAVGLLLFFPLSARFLTGLQGLTVIGFTALLSIATPMLWLDPLGPLFKNVPVLALICVWASLQKKR